MKKKSFTLIEILVFTTIISIFFIAAMSVTVFFLKNIKTQQYKIIATHLLKEAIEWLKYEKEFDWNTFALRDVNNGLGTTYCLNDLSWNSQGSCFQTFGSPLIFKRELIIKKLNNPVTKIELTITVSWNDVGSVNKITSKQILSIIE